MRTIAVLALLALAQRTAAQQSARIEGVVTDSVHNKPLSDAIVYVTREEPKQPELFRALVTDKDGHYRLDSLIAGRYFVSFSHALLDSLQVSTPALDVRLATGEHARVDLAIPPAATLQMRACQGLRLQPGTGAVVGHVSDAETDRTIPGAMVVVSWNDITLDRATLRTSATQRTGAMRVDSSGVYRLCGVPTSIPLLLQVQVDGRAGSALRTEVPEDVGIRVLDLSYSASASRALASTTDTTNGRDTPGAELLAGTAALAGTIRSPSGAPLSDVVLRVVDAAGSARTDSVGRFTLSGLPAGSQLLEARHIGYLIGRRPVELRSGKTIDVQLVLDRIVMLDSVRVLARRNNYKQFEADKYSPFGRFLDEQQIEARHLSETSDLFYTVLGFRVVGRGFDAQLVNTRGGRIGGACRPNIVIDNMQNQDINLVSPSDIGAMEIYADGFGGPPGANHGCGAVVIWTKR